MSRSMLTSLFALVLSVVPACDGEDYAALGISAEELDRMSAEELDALAESEDASEVAAEGPDALRNPAPPPTHSHDVPASDDLGTRPRFTHAERNPAAPDALPEFTNGPRPTHGGDIDDIRVNSVEPEGCDTHGDDEPTLAAR